MYRWLFIISCIGVAGATCFPRSSLAQETSTFFLETFDAVTPPELPAGWIDAQMLWESSSSVSSSGSGLNNITIAGSVASAVQTPAIDLSGMTSGTLQYLIRRTSTYEQDSLVVRASTDGGSSFSLILLDKGEALPATDGSYESISVPIPSELLGVSDAIVMFEALGGSTSGANIRVDDVEIWGLGEVAGTASIFGFAADSSSVDEVTGTFDVPLFLDFTNTEGLQGLQFEIMWDAGSFGLTDVVRGSAITAEEDWQVDFEPQTGGVTVVLLGNQLAALSSGVYDPLMTLQFTVDEANSADSSLLMLVGVLGSLSVRTGDDASLETGLAAHTVDLSSGEAVFSPDATSLDLGVVNVDEQGQAVVTVTNSGTADLVISSVGSSNGLFEAAPSSAAVAPGLSQAFTVTFSPTFELFGFQEGELTFLHNAAGGSDVVALSGTGVGGRGDASEDGIVDAMDLVLGIDYVLERVTPAGGQLASIDVYPFDLPDGLLDVRDLTVLSQAILIGFWPDDSPLPQVPPAGESVDKTGGSQWSLVQIEYVVENGISMLYLNLETEVRAFQFSLGGLPADHPVLYADVLQAAGLTALLHFDKARSELRMLGAMMNGGTVDPGRYPLAVLDSDPILQSIEMGYALAVSADGSRLPVAFSTSASTGMDDAATLPALSVENPYPNPYLSRQHTGMHLPFVLGKTQYVSAEVFDILGRRVASLSDGMLASGRHNLIWNGKDPEGATAAPGLYLIKIKTSESESTRVVVLQ